MTSQIRNYRFLDFLRVLYITIMLITIVLVYKTASFHGFIFSTPTVLLAFWYSFADVIAEVYGYEVCKRLIWQGLICEFIFNMGTYLLVNLLTSPPHIENAYDLVFGNLPRAFLGSACAIIASAFLNAYIISKWKILIKGRFFWFRSLCSTALASFIFSAVITLVMFSGTLTFSEMAILTIDTFLLKLVLEPIYATFATFLAGLLKRLENLDVYDYDVEYNPFKLGEKS